MSDDMKLIDVHGVEHKLARHHINWMISVGWLSFFLAAVLNIIYYKLHPSAVDFNLGRMGTKLFLNIFGRPIYIQDILGLFQIIVIIILYIFY